MKKYVKNQKGFTLVEMIIAVALISVFFTVVVTVMTRTLNSYVTMKQTTEAIKMADVIGSGMVKELEFAQNIEFTAEGMNYTVKKGSSVLPMNGTATVASYTSDSIVIEGKPEIFGVVFDPGLYANNSVRLRITKAATQVLAVEMEIIDDSSNELVYKTKRTIHLYNIS